MKFIASLIALSLTGLSILILPTKTLAAQDWQNNRLSSLQKITVGPWDNFEASVSRDDQRIYFTRDRNQVPNIYQQQLSSINTQEFIGEQGDAKQPALSPDQTQLAFVFYGHDAQGDVCLQTIGEDEIRCITNKNSADSSPFWIGNNELGYLRRDGIDAKQNIVIHSLSDEKKQAIYSGIISSPNASTDGRYIIFNLISNVTTGASSTDLEVPRMLSVYDRQNQQLVQPPKMDLPGFTGTHKLSVDDQYLYFSHYLNDTNGDQRIDGNDNSILFRLPLQTWLSSRKALLPEQLTAVDQNCNFPTLSEQSLYVTCAFEGSLDIYRLPLGGVVPQAWNQQQLEEAHLSARSHADRLLLINTLRYRFQEDDSHLLERLLSNHLEIGELTAAQYYLDQLATLYQTDKPKLTALYHILHELLTVKQSKQRIPVGIVTARFNRLANQARKNISQLDGADYLKLYVDSYLDFELGEYSKALTTLKKIDLKRSMLPLERYLIFSLLSQLLHSEPELLIHYYPFMYRSTELNQEARIHYAFNFLKLQQQLEPDNKKRAIQLSKIIQASLPTEIKALFEIEQSILMMLNTTDQKEQTVGYKRLVKQLKTDRENHYLRKAAHIRAITQLGEAELFQFMELLSRHWLLITHISEMEFFNTAQQYSIITMDKAYGILASGNPVKAYNTFYSAIRQTNNLEAHYHFIALGLNPALNKQENLIQAYDDFEAKDLIGDNRHYAAALRIVIQAQLAPKQAMKLWPQALSELALVKFGDVNLAMRDLLTGYIYHQQLIASKNGYNFDKLAYQKAHYHYMIALDLGRENHRISASVYENAAWLHFDTGQYAYSADLFSQRFKFGFPSDEAQLSALWAAARSSFYANDNQTAWEYSEQALNLSQKINIRELSPFVEKAAFYAQQAGKYTTAIHHYQTLFDNDGTLVGHNRSKALLSYAFTLMKNKELGAARERLNELLSFSTTLSTKAASSSLLLPLVSERQQLLAYGFLAKMATTPAEKIKHLQQRIGILKSLEGDTEKLGYSEIERTAFLSKDYINLALSFEQSGQLFQLRDATLNSLDTAMLWSLEIDDDAGPVIYNSLVNSLSLALSHADTFGNVNEEAFTTQVTSTLETFSGMTFRSSAIIVQEAKLQLLWHAYRAIVLKQDHSMLGENLDQVLANKEVRALNNIDPDSHEELKLISQSLLAL
jgi:hypothetical protein